MAAETACLEESDSGTGRKQERFAGAAPVLHAVRHNLAIIVDAIGRRDAGAGARIGGIGAGGSRVCDPLAGSRADEPKRTLQDELRYLQGT